MSTFHPFLFAAYSPEKEVGHPSLFHIEFDGWMDTVEMVKQDIFCSCLLGRGGPG